MFVFGARGRSGVAFVVALSAWTALAGAQVTQTDPASTPLPQPVAAAESALVNNSWGWNANTKVNRDPNGVTLNPGIRYADFYTPPSYPQFVTGDAISLSGLFKWRHEAIDPVKDAKTWPGYFSGKCGFTAELVLMGGNCQAQFGWYNVADPTSKTPPAANEIFPVMTGKPRDQLKCVQEDGKTPKTDGFCPLAWDNRHPYDLSITRWTAKQFPSGDISKDPRYKGGYLALAMIGDAIACTSNKFSMFEHNQRNASGAPWVTTLIYQSTVDPEAFYFAFEDLPMSAADWTKSSASVAGANGDFNDLVFYVRGLTCLGGNKPCDTGQYGACAVGRTDCAPEGKSAACLPVQQAGIELCDNIDNDCDGIVDEGDALCSNPSAPICYRGACVASCMNGAFPCPLGTTCGDNGRCVEPACAALSCQPGEVCRAGACVEPCAGVTCPYGSRCELGECVNPCAGVSCASDRVCEEGVCVAKCDCRGCDAGLSCSSNGRCVDAACANKACAAGTTCKLGACVDPCAGVICPGNGTCFNGACSVPASGGGGQSGGGSISFAGSSAAIGGTSSFGGRPASAGEAGELADAGAAGSAEGGAADAAGAAGHAAGGSGAGAMAGAHAGGNAEAHGGSAGSEPSAPEQSSSCGCAVPGPPADRRALAVFGLVFGLLLTRRRRQRSSRAR